MTHSAILPTPQHAHVATVVLPGNLQLAISAVMLHDVSFNDASKISAEIARHGLPPLVWEPPITAPAETKPPVVVDPEPPIVTSEPTEPEQPT